MAGRLHLDQIAAEQLLQIPRDLRVLVVEAVRAGVEAEVPAAQRDGIAARLVLRLIEREGQAPPAGIVSRGQTRGSAAEDGNMSRRHEMRAVKRACMREGVNSRHRQTMRCSQA